MFTRIRLGMAVVVLVSATVAVAPAGGMVDPEIGISLSPASIDEEAGDSLSVTLTLDQAVVSNTDVTVDTGVREGLVEYNAFFSSFPTGMSLVAIDATKQFITVRLQPSFGTSGTALIPLFNDPADDGSTQTWSLVAGTGYTIDPANASDSVLITDSDTNARPEVPDQIFDVATDAVLTIAAPGLLAGATDDLGAPLTAALGSIWPSDGSVTVNSDGSFTYDPDPAFTGTDLFSIRANDGNWNSYEAYVTVEVTASALPRIYGLGVGAVEGDAGSSVVSVPIVVRGENGNPTGSAVPITVDWRTYDAGTAPIAEPGLDYVAASGSLTIPAGVTEATVEITVLGDVIAEPPVVWGEWGLVIWSNPTNASIDFSEGLFGTGIFVILDDD